MEIVPILVEIVPILVEIVLVQKTDLSCEGVGDICLIEAVPDSCSRHLAPILANVFNLFVELSAIAFCASSDVQRIKVSSSTFVACDAAWLVPHRWA